VDMRNTNRCQDTLSAGDRLEQLIQETNSMLKISDFSIPSLPPHTFNLDRTSYNSLIQQVVEFKILLYQLRRVLEQSNDHEGNSELQLLKARITQLEKDVRTKDQRIQDLEEILYSRRGRQSVRQCVRARRGVSSEGFKPCNHVWGPCANDHRNHHARRQQNYERGRGRRQVRSLSAASRL